MAVTTTRRRRREHYGGSPASLPFITYESNDVISTRSNNTQKSKSILFRPLCISTFFAVVIIIIVGAAHHRTSQKISSRLTSSAWSQRRVAALVLESQPAASYYDNVRDSSLKETVYDVIVVGCGPAGLTASLYASRMGLSVLVIGSPSSGSLSGTDSLDNFPSFSAKGGQQWLDATMSQAIKFGTKFIDPIWLAIGLEQDKSSNSNHFLRITVFNGNHDNRETLQTKSLIIATGSSPRKLGLQYEEELWGRYLHNCALCDGDMYVSRATKEGWSQKSVVVIGGGDAALEAVNLLSRLGVSSIHWIHRRNEFRARKSALDKVRNLQNVKIWQPFVVTEWVVKEINGRMVLDGVRIVVSTTDGIADPEASSSLTIPCDGAFLMLGSTPNTNWLKNSGIALDSTTGLIQHASSADDKISELPAMLSTSTSLPGVFAAGEVVDGVYKQALTASSDGAKAAMDVERYLRASSFRISDVPVKEIVSRFDSSDILSNEGEQSFIECDLTRVDCIKALLTKHTVVVFSKPFCPYCRRALETLRSVMQNGESPFVVDLTELGEKGLEVQQTLGEWTGRRTVPNVFVRGKTIGGGDETVALHRDGKLSRLIVGDTTNNN